MWSSLVLLRILQGISSDQPKTYPEALNSSERTKYTGLDGYLPSRALHTIAFCALQTPRSHTEAMVSCDILVACTVKYLGLTTQAQMKQWAKNKHYAFILWNRTLKHKEAVWSILVEKRCWRTTNEAFQCWLLLQSFHSKAFWPEGCKWMLVLSSSSTLFLINSTCVCLEKQRKAIHLHVKMCFSWWPGECCHPVLILPLSPGSHPNSPSLFIIFQHCSLRAKITSRK